MKQTASIDEIYRAKEERRKHLSSLPIEEKVKLIEKLHEFGLTLRSARARFKPWEGSPSKSSGLRN